MSRTYPVSELESGPDYKIFDPFLGSYVDRTALFCQIGLTPRAIVSAL